MQKRNINKTKPWLKALLTSSLLSASLLLSTQAHADFRKALDAYIARDGDTLLKEVKDAVDKKDDDGLIQFLLEVNSRSTQFCGLSNESQYDELLSLLSKSVKVSSVDAEYFLLNKSCFSAKLQQNVQKMTQKQLVDFNKKTRESYIKKDSQLAMLDAGGVDAAKAGNPFAQLRLAYRYFRVKGHVYSCENNQDPTCSLPKNQAQGLYWLKQSAKTFDRSGYVDAEYIKNLRFLIEQVSSSKADGLRQSMLWAALQDKATGCLTYLKTQSNTQCELAKFQEKGLLKGIDPKANNAWQEINFRAKYFDELPLPDLLLEARKALDKEDFPVISAYFTESERTADNSYAAHNFGRHLTSGDTPYLLNVYKDGRVQFFRAVFVSPDKYFPELMPDYVTKVSSDHVKKFLVAIDKAGFYTWNYPQRDKQSFCDLNCGETELQITVRDNDLVKREKFYVPSNVFSSSYSEDFHKPYNSLLRTNSVQIAKLRTLVEQYFPTNELRCRSGRPQAYYKECMQKNTNINIFSQENI